jgi:hypothetical protein
MNKYPKRNFLENGRKSFHGWAKETRVGPQMFLLKDANFLFSSLLRAAVISCTTTTTTSAVYIFLSLS